MTVFCASPYIEEDVSVLCNQLLFAVDRKYVMVIEGVPGGICQVEAVGSVVASVHVPVVTADGVQVIDGVLVIAVGKDSSTL